MSCRVVSCRDVSTRAAIKRLYEGKGKHGGGRWCRYISMHIFGNTSCCTSLPSLSALENAPTFPVGVRETPAMCHRNVTTMEQSGTVQWKEEMKSAWTRKYDQRFQDRLVCSTNDDNDDDGVVVYSCAPVCTQDLHHSSRYYQTSNVVSTTLRESKFGSASIDAPHFSPQRPTSSRLSARSPSSQTSSTVSTPLNFCDGP